MTITPGQNIGRAAAESGITAKMIRHYEAIGLVPSAKRLSSNYRSYTSEDVHRLTFIRRARALGFSIDRIRELLALWDDRNRHSSDVKAVALAHVAEMELRITHMREMANVLRTLADACEGDERAECPIIRKLEGRRLEGAQAPAGV